MIIAKLKESGWIRREFDVITPEGLYEVDYSGQGIGYEQVSVNGQIVNRRNSYFWYVPEFEFTVGGYPARIEVRVNPWFTMRYFSLEINGEQIYFEGEK